MTTGLLIYFVRRISYFALQPARSSFCCGVFWWWEEAQTDIRVAMRRVYHNFFCVEVSR